MVARAATAVVVLLLVGTVRAGRRTIGMVQHLVARAFGDSSRSVYGLATLDVHGRVADRSVMIALGWAAGPRLGIRESGGLIIVDPDLRGVFRVTKEGHVRLPAVVRQWCGLTAGDRPKVKVADDRSAASRSVRGRS